MGEMKSISPAKAIKKLELFHANDFFSMECVQCCVSKFDSFLMWFIAKINQIYDFSPREVFVVVILISSLLYSLTNSCLLYQCDLMSVRLLLLLLDGFGWGDLMAVELNTVRTMRRWLNWKITSRAHRRSTKAKKKAHRDIRINCRSYLKISLWLLNINIGNKRLNLPCPGRKMISQNRQKDQEMLLLLISNKF